MTMRSVTPGESPVSLNEARGWLRGQGNALHLYRF